MRREQKRQYFKKQLWIAHMVGDQEDIEGYSYMLEHFDDPENQTQMGVSS